MLATVAAVAGTVIGWGSAASLIFLEPRPQFVLLQAFALSVGIVCVAWLMLTRRSRPLGAAYDLGYEAGRRDGVRGANGRGKVVHMPVDFERRERRAIND